ncbi:DUF3131 domain-containing protein [Ramlibacter sp. AN1015]|uniref:DUF3131 domain-containing protein n=1 Tax=Ramlibacter sp. AN1015 TaxID=3133428 RepID=UPI0030BDED82
MNAPDRRDFCRALAALPALALVPAARGQSRADPLMGSLMGCPPGPLPASSMERRRGPLDAREQAMARVCWKYFENNTQPSGLANAVDNYPSTTLWDTASYMAALLSVREFAIVTPQEVDRRMAAVLAALERLELFRGELPNKVYHAQTLAKVDYTNKPGEVGFSAIDIGRMLIWLRIVKERLPQFADAVDRVVLRWNFDRVIDRSGMMFGALIDKDGKTQYVQEGRLGYEEYAARGFELWGFVTELAARAEPYATAPIYCVQVPYDARDPRKYQQHNYVVTESYALDGIEFGWDRTFERGPQRGRATHPWMKEFADRVYQAQENRFAATGILTARSEHQLDVEPYFVYDTVFSDGYAWNTITDTGRHVPQFAAIALKAALGMWALWKSPYTELLFDTIAQRFEPDRGYYEGILENGKGPIKAFTANNNGIMLETLLFKQQGPLLQWGPERQGLWERRTQPYGPDARTRPNASPGQPR